MAQQIHPAYTEALELILHGQRIGILVHYSGGRNILTFDPDFCQMAAAVRPVFTLTQFLKKR